MAGDRFGAPPDDGSIALGEIWRVLGRRWGWIVGSLAITMAVAITYLALAAPVYEARVILRVGQVGGAGLFESPDVLASRLFASFGENAADGVKRPRPFLKRVVAPRSLPGVIELVAQADSAEGSATFLGHIASVMEQQHNVVFEENRQLLLDQLRNIDVRNSQLRAQYDALSTTLDALTRGGELAQASVVLIERSRLATAMIELDAEKPKAALKLAPPLTQPTALISEIVAPARPAGPRGLFVLALASIVGLLGGAVIALMREFVLNTKQIGSQQ